jgi:hypothetical protein
MIFIELWSTQQTETIDRHQEKDKYVRTTIRELIIYIVFLVILSIGKNFIFLFILNFIYS